MLSEVFWYVQHHLGLMVVVMLMFEMAVDYSNVHSYYYTQHGMFKCT